MAFFKFTNGTLANADEVNADFNSAMDLGLRGITRSYTLPDRQIIYQGTINTGSTTAWVTGGSYIPSGSPLDDFGDDSLDTTKWVVEASDNSGEQGDASGSYIWVADQATGGAALSSQRVRIARDLTTFPGSTVVNMIVYYNSFVSNTTTPKGGWIEARYGNVVVGSHNVGAINGAGNTWQGSFTFVRSADLGSWEFWEDGVFIDTYDASAAADGFFDINCYGSGASAEHIGSLRVYDVRFNPPVGGSSYIDVVSWDDTIVSGNYTHGGYIASTPIVNYFVGSTTPVVGFSADNGATWVNVTEGSFIAFGTNTGSFLAQAQYSLGSDIGYFNNSGSINYILI